MSTAGESAGILVGFPVDTVPVSYLVGTLKGAIQCYHHLKTCLFSLGLSFSLVLRPPILDGFRICAARQEEPILFMWMKN